jgi:hypothetical protein
MYKIRTAFSYEKKIISNIFRQSGSLVCCKNVCGKGKYFEE